MSVDAMKWAWEQAVTGTQKLVLLSIADHAWSDGTNAWPSVKTIHG